MQTRQLHIQFQTPAFLGDAEQSGRWRTPPFKAQLRQGLRVDVQVSHLDLERVQHGDTVIGTLPVNLAAAVCGKGAQFLNLSLDQPPHWRGRELSADDMRACNARLEGFHICAQPMAYTATAPQTP